VLKRVSREYFPLPSSAFYFTFLKHSLTLHEVLEDTQRRGDGKDDEE
jgi:hypothetical protein